MHRTAGQSASVLGKTPSDVVVQFPAQDVPSELRPIAKGLGGRTPRRRVQKALDEPHASGAVAKVFSEESFRMRGLALVHDSVDGADLGTSLCGTQGELDLVAPDTPAFVKAAILEDECPAPSRTGPDWHGRCSFEREGGHGLPSPQ